MENKILKSFTKGRDGDLVMITYNVLSSLKGNAHFSNPVPSLADIEKALGEYQAALSNANGRDKTMISIKNDKRTELRSLLLQLAGYVTGICNGDRSMLLSSGFDISKETGTSVQLSKIEQPDVELGPPGQATTRFKRVIGARMYMHQYTADPLSTESQWTDKITTDTVHTFTGLQSGVKYWFRITALGKGGTASVSTAVPRIIQ